MESKGEIVENLVKDYEKGLSKDQLREYEQWKRSGAGGPSGTSEPTAEYGGARPEEAAAPSGRDGGGEPGTRGGTEGELDSVRRIAERHAEIEKHLGTKYSFSHERANHGEVFYENERGETSLAVIPDEIFYKIGVAPVPFKLTETMAWHVYINHGKELGLKNIDDAIDFVLNVVNNVDHVRLGKENSFVFSVENTRKGIAHRAITVFVEADSGEFMGIKTSGFDRMSSLEKKPILWESGAVSTPEAIATPTVTTIKAQQGDKHLGRAEGQSIVNSEGKVTNSASDKQENGEESSGNVVREASLFDYDNEDERARRQQQGARQLSLFGEGHREEVGSEHRMQRERQMSLFDRDFSEEAESDIDSAASRLDERLDEYTEKLSELLTVPEELRTDEMEEAVVGIRDALMGDLVDYYESKRNDRGEARERARDMIVQLQAQAIIAETRRRKLLSEETEGDADGETATPPTTPADRPADASKGGLREATDGDLKQTHVTAGGEELSFNHTGWLPKLGGGHFTLMERRFVEDGSVPMSGTTRVESADDVAYMMRAMECTHVL